LREGDTVVRLMHGVAHAVDVTQRVPSRAQGVGHLLDGRERPLVVWDIHYRRNLPLESAISRVRGHSDDFHVARLWPPDREAPTSSDQRRMRECCVAYPRNRFEPSLQISVERCNFRIAMSGLEGVQFKQQHILTIETQLDGLQI